MTLIYFKEKKNICLIYHKIKSSWRHGLFCAYVMIVRPGLLVKIKKIIKIMIYDDCFDFLNHDFMICDFISIIFRGAGPPGAKNSLSGWSLWFGIVIGINCYYLLL